MNFSKKTIAVIGPTASGKSDIAIVIAKKYNGAVIGVDSRQIYRHMDLGSGKEPGKIVRIPQTTPILSHPYISDRVPHYMIDVVAPTTDYNVTKFTKKAQRIITALHTQNTLPIICGGTHFWVQALLENTSFPTVLPNKKLRKKCEEKSTTELLEILQKKDTRRAGDIIAKNEQNNRPRIIRAIEIATALGTVPPAPKTDYKKLQENNLIIAIVPSMERITKNITNRLQPRLDAGMLDEVYALHHAHHVTWKKLEQFGLEYKWCTLYLRNRCTEEGMKHGIIHESRRFAKRQITWIRRWEKLGASIHYITTPKEAMRHMQNFLY